jgi:phosphoribosylamine-glycine ligase
VIDTDFGAGQEAFAAVVAAAISVPVAVAAVPFGQVTVAETGTGAGGGGGGADVPVVPPAPPPPPQAARESAVQKIETQRMTFDGIFTGVFLIVNSFRGTAITEALKTDYH